MCTDGENSKPPTKRTTKEFSRSKLCKGTSCITQTANRKNRISVGKIEPNPIEIEAIPVVKKHPSPTARELDPRAADKVQRSLEVEDGADEEDEEIAVRCARGDGECSIRGGSAEE